MQTLIQHQAVINTVGTIFYDNDNKVWAPAKSGAAFTTPTPVETAFPPVPYGAVSLLKVTHSAAEVKQLALIAGAETLVPGVQYKLIIECPQEAKEFGPAPEIYSTLCSATDTKTTLYDRILAKWAAYAGSRVTVGHKVTVPYTLGGAGVVGITPVAGDIMTQTTSGAKIRLTSITLTGGTWGGGDAAGVIHGVLISGTWTNAAKTLVDEILTTKSCTTTAVLTTDHETIVVEDKGDYFNAGIPKKAGASVVRIVGFTTATVTISCEATYSFGIGTRMLQDIPSWDLQKRNPLSGTAFFNPTVLPVAGTTYSRYDFSVDTSVEIDHLLNTRTNRPSIYSVWVKEDGSLAAWDATIDTVIALAAGGTYTP
jgi:hypothetical protein